MEVHGGTEYKEFLAHLCVKREVNLYLEVGVQNGFNLSNITVPIAIGVDPNFAIKADITQGKKIVHLFKMTSDAFFKEKSSFVSQLGGANLSFLDGMHLFEYLLRDFYNAEACAANDGIIAMHDCMPFDGGMIERVYCPDLRPEGPFRTFWTGDVWKIVPILRKYRPELKIYLVDCNPTGLVCVGNLDPSSTVLKREYYNIVQEYYNMPNDENAIKQFYAENPTTKAGDVLKEDDHSLFFRL